MWIACNQDRYPGSVFPSIWPCDIRDATGQIISGCNVIAFNTTTGEVHKQIDMENPCPQVEIQKHPAPLAMVPHTPDSDDADTPIIVEGSDAQR